MQAFDDRGLLAEVFPDHLESWNFVQCLLAPKEMGNNRELIQNQTFGFFEHHYLGCYIWTKHNGYAILEKVKVQKKGKVLKVWLVDLESIYLTLSLLEF